MKILFTSVGRRVELMQAFRRASERLGQEVEIIGADISDLAAALSFCDTKVRVPRISDPSYIPFLKEYCAANAVDALIPTIDTDLLILSENRDDFGDTKVLISAPEMIRYCRDKWKTGEIFAGAELSCPAVCGNAACYDLGFPAFIKPKDGSSSIGAYRVMNAEELDALSKIVPDYVIQPFVRGTEYTVDAFCDWEGNPVLITPRVRLAVRGGEVLITRIEQDRRIIEEMMALCAVFKPRGAITVQLIREEETGIDQYIEINPRFGGGAPLSIKAGADSAEMVIRCLRGEKLSYVPFAAEDGAVFSRFDQCIQVEQ